MLGALGAVDVEITLVQHDRGIGVLDMDVFVSDVVDTTEADVGAGPGLDASSRLSICQHDGIQSRERNMSYLAVQYGDVLNPGVLDNVLDTRVLSNTSHAHTVGVVAP